MEGGRGTADCKSLRDVERSKNQRNGQDNVGEMFDNGCVSVGNCGQTARVEKKPRLFCDRLTTRQRGTRPPSAALTWNEVKTTHTHTKMVAERKGNIGGGGDSSFGGWGLQ